MKIKLDVILDAIEMADDNYTYFLDLETGESVFLADELITGLDNDCLLYTSQLDGNIRLRGQILKGGGYSDNFLDKRHAKMVGQRKPAGSGNHGMKGNIS